MSDFRHALKDYRNLKYTSNIIDVYYPLANRVKLIRRVLPYFKGTHIDIGCGRTPFKQMIQEEGNIDKYIGIDIENPIYQTSDEKPDMFWDGLTLPLEDNSIDSAMIIEVLEHVPDPVIVLKEINRVLKKGSTVFITVPFLWNLHDVPYDEYRYTPFCIRRMLKDSNFEEVEMEGTGGWDASLATILGAWVRRSTMSKRKRNILTKIIAPIVKRLYKSDAKYDLTSFTEGKMYNGFWCIASKK